MANWFKLDKLVKLVIWLLLGIILIIVLIGVYPYTHLFSIASKNIVVQLPPNFKPIADWAIVFLCWVIGFACWGVINLIELFPVFLQRDRDLINTLIGEFNFDNKILNENDSNHVSALKRAYNSLPALNLRNARIAAIFAYLVDFYVNVLSTPLAKNSSEMIFIIATGQFSRLNQQSLLILAVLLFGLEITIKCFLHLSEANRLIQKSRKNRKRQVQN
jgi:hypothetical protein